MLQKSYIELISFEDFDSVEFVKEITEPLKFKIEGNKFIKQMFALKDKRDNMVVTITDYDDKIRIGKDFDSLKVEEYFTQFLLLCDEGDEIKSKIVVTIYKAIENHKLSIYSMSKFTNYLLSLSIENLIGKFQENILEQEYIGFDMISDSGSAFTSKLYFLDSEDKTNIEHIFRNNKEYNLNEIRNEFCNYVGKRNIYCSPYDFYFTDYNLKNSDIRDIFNRVTIALSLIYLSNLSDLEENNIIYKIDGYKTIRDDVNLQGYQDVLNISNSIFQIFDWVYNNKKNNIADKLGITRNIMSLYMKDGDLSNISSDIITSIHSGYDIYLKENVERYIEVLNQVTIFLNDLNNQASILAIEFTNKFRNNLIGFFSFLMTTLIFNIISTGNINNIFTKDITILTLALMGISAVYLIISRLDAREGLEKLRKRYERNKKYYSSILDIKDIERIFDGDSYYDEDKKFLESNIKRYTTLWIIAIVLMLMTLCILGTIVDVWQFIIPNCNL